MSAQATGTGSLQQSTLAPAVNGAGTEQAQQQPLQQAPTGIAGNGQSTIASAESSLTDRDLRRLARKLAEKPTGKENPQLRQDEEFILDELMEKVSGVRNYRKPPQAEQQPQATNSVSSPAVRQGQFQPTSEQTRVANAVTRALVESQRYPGMNATYVSLLFDKEEYIKMEVDDMLMSYTFFGSSGSMITPSPFVDAACGAVAQHCPKISTADLTLFAASLGYKLEVTETSAGNGVSRVCKVTGTITRLELEQHLKAKTDDGKKA